MGEAFRRYIVPLILLLAIYGGYVFLQSELQMYEYKASARYSCRQAMREAIRDKPVDVEEEFMNSTRGKGLRVDQSQIVFEINQPCNKNQGCSCAYDIDVALEVPLPILTDFGVHPGFVRERHMEESDVELNLNAY